MSGRKVSRVECEALDLELTEPFAIATGAQNVARNVLVRVTLEDGTVGLGEAAPFPAVSGETQAGSLAAIEEVASALVGADPARYRANAALLADAIGTEPAARCGVEQALFDALARHARLPLWALFGGAAAVLDTDMTITAGDTSHAVASAHAIAMRGIKTLKVKVGALSHGLDADRIAAVHDAVPGARLVLDANGGYTPDAALGLLSELRSKGVPIALFEQPVVAHDLEGLERVTREGGVLVCADEAVRSPVEVLEIVRRRAAQAINIKLMKCGVVEALGMWSIAQAAGLQCMIGGMVESILSMSFSAHFAFGLGGFSFVDLDTPMFIASSPFSGGFTVSSGRLSLGHIERGIGVTIEDRPPTP